MNAERLLALFDRVSEAPDAVARIRWFIMDLAVRGKLVEQNSAEPSVASARSLAREDCPYPLPSSWCWVRVDEVSTARLGKMLDKAKNRGTPKRYLRNVNVRWFDFDLSDLSEMRFEEVELSEFELRAGDVLICEGGEPGRAAVWDDREKDIYFQKAIHRVRFKGFVDPHFFVLTLKAGADSGRLAKYFTGSGIQHFTGRSLDSFPLPLPPPAEQRRIIARVDELMALCDQLEAARTARETARDRLAAASLARLNTLDPETFQADARFALATLPAFTTRPDQAKTLRQTILNLAVRGKLVSQDPSDEPASELLKRISKEKARLVETRKIAPEKPLPQLDQGDFAFELPCGWEWVRLGHLATMVTSGSRDWARHYSSEGAIFVRMGNLSKDHYRLRLGQIQHVKPPQDGEGTRTRLDAGDILISITGEVGMLGLIPDGFGEAYINQHTAMVRPVAEIKNRYLPELFRSSFAQAQFNEPQRGIKNSFRLTDITQFVVPLPPLAEQHRIVARVDELMALCDRLEASLAAADTANARLLDALLRQALGGWAETLETEAA